MSLIRKHGAVLQAWACLDLVRKTCCRQAPEFKNCADAIPCEKTDFLYDAYLATVGMASTYTHICDNKTLSGCTAVFQLGS